MDSKKPKIERHEFASLSDLLKDNERWESKHPGGEASRQPKQHDFNDTNTYEETLELTQKGWKYGADRVNALRTTLDTAVQTLVAAKAATVMYDVDGDWVDIGRLVTGEPECCGSWDTQGDDAKNKVVRIVANVSVSWMVKQETIFARGAACLAAVDILESLGKRVELWVSVGLNDYRHGRVDTHLIAKPAGQPVDTDRLAFVLCHADMFRRILFAHMEINDHDPSRCVPTPVFRDEDAIFLPELRTGKVPTHEENIQQVIKICEMAGIVFADEDIAGLVRRVI
jgi:hypothetical protein